MLKTLLRLYFSSSKTGTMKKIMIVSFALLLTCNLQAQLLKKLKDKAEKALESKPKQTTAASESNSDAKEDNQSSENNNPKEAKQRSAPPSNGSVVFTLGPDETLFYDETAILAKNNGVSYQFVVGNKKYEYFLIDNGTRTGPFKQAPAIKSMKSSDDESADGNNDGDDKLNMGGEQKDPVSMQYAKTIGGKLHIALNGKNYGPYDYVSKMLVSTDKKQFFALVVMGGESPMMYKMGMGQYYMVNEKGLKQKIGSGMSMGLKFSASKGFAHCMASVMDNKSQQIFTATTSGKQTEGSMADLYGGEKNKTMVSDKGDIITIPAQSPTQILVNGDEAARFSVPLKSMDRLFLMPDISKSVYYSDGKLHKADGTTVSTKGILYPKVVTVNNEVVMYYFKVYQNESGAKDVYLCKTII